MKYLLLLLLTTLCMLLIGACTNKSNSDNLDEPPKKSEEIPLDKESVKIGEQIWSIKNLNVTKFRNGDIIPETKTNDEWMDAYEYETPAWCYFNNDSTNDKVSGKLYNWYTINDPRGLCPEGWSVPSDDDWNELVTFCGGESGALIKIKDSGFTGLKGNFRAGKNGDFYTMSSGYWWSTTEIDDIKASNMWTDLMGTDLLKDKSAKGDGLSVRCIKKTTNSDKITETTNSDYEIGKKGQAGGIVFYDKGEYSDGWRYLEASPNDQSEGDASWGCSNIRGTFIDIGTGKANTEVIISNCGQPHIAARICDDYSFGGYDDWFLPSIEELKELDNVIKLKHEYWSSSEFNSSEAMYCNDKGGRNCQHKSSTSSFGISKACFAPKIWSLYVRAIRSF